MMKCYGCDRIYGMELLTAYVYQDLTELLCPECLLRVEAIVA